MADRRGGYGGDRRDWIAQDKRFVKREEFDREMNTLRQDLEETKVSSWRTERYLVGGLSDSGKYTLGLIPIVTIIGIVVVALLVPVFVHTINQLLHPIPGAAP